jgi:methyl-accepting chemotaxis protein
MSRLRFTRQFAVVTLLFVLPSALMGTLLYRETQRDIALAGQERSGIAGIVPAVRMLHALQLHGMVNAAIVGGDLAATFAAPPEQDRRALEAAAARVDAELAALLAAQSDRSAVLGTETAAKTLSDHWTSLRKEAIGMTLDRSLDVHRAVSDEILELVGAMAERSRLLVDPQPRTAFLQDASVRRLPELIAALGQARAIMHGGKRDPSALAMQYQLGMKSLAAASRDLVNVGPVGTVAAYTAPVAAFLEKTGERVKVLAGGAVATAEEVQQGTAAIDAVLASDTAALVLLDEAIADRAAADRRVQAAMLAAVLGSLVVAAYMLAGFFRSMRTSMGEAVELADHVARGDLSRRIVVNARNEMGDMISALNRMSDRMSGLVGDVKRSLDAVTSSSLQVAQANTELSARTERQAASLDTMAASAEQLSTAVSGSATRIDRAGGLVAGAAEAVAGSNDSMARAVQTMQAAGEMSRRIADITGVIDGIAFQTNILALNAAVEAARVGTEGRGFAVVAGEIRSLAQRAADSAREIRTLIADAVVTIESGGTLVGEAGRALDETTRTMRSAVEIMQEVTRMAHEQSGNLEQITRVVSEMNGVTQQNAAFVQKTAEIAGQQERSTREVVAAVEGFRIEAPKAGGEARIEWRPEPSFDVLSPAPLR